MRIALALFLACHGAVHAVMWTLPLTDAVDDMPFDLGAAGGLALSAALVTYGLRADPS